MKDHDPALVRKTFREVVENQIRDNDPPETRQTYDRLLSKGIPEEEVWPLLSAVVATEMLEIVKDRRAFDRARYVERLMALPKLPFD